MSQEKMEAMCQLLHEENKAIMIILLGMSCYPQDYEKVKNNLIKDWEDLFNKIMVME